MDTFIQTLINLGLGFLGLAIFTVWSIREHLAEFSFKILFQRNVPFWIWSVTMLLLFSILLTVSPQGATAIKTVTGLDVVSEPSAFIAMGLGLARIARDIQTNKKKKEDED